MDSLRLKSWGGRVVFVVAGLITASCVKTPDTSDDASQAGVESTPAGEISAKESTEAEGSQDAAGSNEPKSKTERYPLGPEMRQLEADLGTDTYRSTILSWRNHNDLNGEFGRADLPDNAARFLAANGGSVKVEADAALRAAYGRRKKVHDDFVELMKQAYTGLNKANVFEREKAKIDEALSTDRVVSLAASEDVRVRVILPAAGADSQWPRWRGPSGQGTSAEKSLPTEWSDKEGVAWKVAVPGSGNSSPVIWGKRIFLTTSFDDGKDRRLLCYERPGGKELWSKRVPEVSPESLRMMKNGWASSTPVTDGDRVIAFFGNAGLVSYTVDGELEWHVPMPRFDGTHGTAASPCLWGDLVILLQEHTDFTDRERKNLSVGIALEKTSGEEVWKIERPNALGWCTPLPLVVGNREELIYGASKAVLSLDPKTGDELWRLDGPTHEVVPTLVYDEGLVYSCSGRNGPTLAIRPGGDGNVSETHLAWRVVRGAPHVPSPVIADGRIYFANDTGILTCLDAKTGRTVYQRRLKGKFTASPVAADGHVYFTNERGDTFVLPTGEKSEVRKLNSLREKTLASPAILDGKIYFRTEKHLWAIDGKS
ncbi:MAG: PQQ-binding-like beta-propeller repeat protein [Planctomycetota bacterium]